MIKAVIFDLDDTLISENKYVKSGFKVISEYLGEKYKLNKEGIYNQLVNLYEEDSKNVFNRWFEKRKIKYTKEDIKKLLKIYRNHIPNIKFYKDVMPTIKKLKEKNIKVGIITDGYIETQKAKLKSINAFEIFDEIILTEELGKEFWKPHPKAFESMKEKLNIDYKEMIYVGDNPQKDFYIGSKYPIVCIRICRENGIYMDKDYKDNIKEKYKIENFKEIFSILRNS